MIQNASHLFIGSGGSGTRVFSAKNSYLDRMGRRRSAVLFFIAGSPPVAVGIGTGFLGADDRVAAGVNAASDPITVAVHAAGAIPPHRILASDPGMPLHFASR
jgi:hypothetical protein